MLYTLLKLLRSFYLYSRFYSFATLILEIKEYPILSSHLSLNFTHKSKLFNKRS